MYQNKGFTLIELLVVVLIIGILSAVALPKYQLAVEKSRAVEALTVLRDLGEAAELFYLANGYYPAQGDDLDISFPRSENFTYALAPNGVDGISAYRNGKPYLLSYRYQHQRGLSHPKSLICGQNGFSPNYAKSICAALGADTSVSVARAGGYARWLISDL
ncbi:MAG: prepilin-type N-terminal cleavage/methylation domain-containing protein [Elusimicrobiaceae bacterium]|nr:prepilin-type N-terminal cleavage/methylation domain-containing protein [Elusimicrobiaceae bacterium]